MRMMTSVSMLPRMIGAAMACSSVKGFGILALHGPHVSNSAGYRRCGRSRWARQMGTGPRPLAADEVAIRGRDRALAGGHGFAVGGEAHRASRLAPLESRIDEKLVEPLGNCIAVHRLRSRYEPRTPAGGDL